VRFKSAGSNDLALEDLAKHFGGYGTLGFVNQDIALHARFNHVKVSDAEAIELFCEPALRSHDNH
jgi:hypothetical protein